MTDFVIQLPALIGVVVGSLATILATTFAERSRWRRQQNVRWDERRLIAYVEFGKILKEIRHVCARMTANRRKTKTAIPLDEREGLVLLTEASVRRSKAWEEVLLLGDADTIAASGRWRDAVYEIELMARSDGDGDIDERWVGANLAVEDARDAFYRTARGSLAVPGSLAGPASRRR